MKSLVVAVAIVMFGALSAFAADAGHYQIVAGKTGMSDRNTFAVLDTQTGAVWIMLPRTTSGQALMPVLYQIGKKKRQIPFSAAKN